MIELELSIMAGDDQPAYYDDLARLLAAFEAREGIRTRITVLTWPEGWTELVKVALYGHGPDVSEVGSTWVSGLVGMNALLPFSAWDIRAVGDPEDFIQPAWQSVSLADDQTVWAMPWLTGTRVIFYRRDLLERAGVDEGSAFQTHAALEATLGRLQEAGIVPWVVHTRRTLNTLHHIASWVWAAGGDFLGPNGKEIVFHAPPARRGMSQYFSLGRYLPAGNRDLSEVEASQLFWQGQAAVTIDGHWILPEFMPRAAPDVVRHLGVALVPGVPFVGGSNLVLWKHCRRAPAALKLIRFLTGPEVQAEYSRCVHLLPARTSALNRLQPLDDPTYPAARQGLQVGRSFPSTRLWGLVEDKLTAVLANIWADVLAVERPDVDAIVARHVDGLARRLRLTFSSS